MDPLRLQEHVHGHLGWLAVAALIHPAIVLRRRRRRAAWAVGLPVALVTVAAALGAAMYPAYRERLRPAMFAHSSPMGFLFERKEHLAFGAVFLAWAGALAYAAAAWTSEEVVREPLRKAAHRAFIAAALVAAVAAVLGTVVASHLTF